MPQVTLHKEIGEGGASLDDSPTATDERVFLVRTDLPASKTLILIHPNTPKVYQQHPENKNLFCRRVIVDRQNSRVFVVTAEYSSEVKEKQKENPLARPPIIRLRSKQGTRLKITDVHGKVKRNKLGDPLAAREVDVSEWVISVLKNVAKLPRWLPQYANAINRDTIRIRGLTYPPETLKMQALDIPDFKFENNQRFLPFAFELHYMRDLWRDRALHEGFWEYVERKVTRQVPDPGSSAGFRTAEVTELVRKRILIDGDLPPEAIPLDKNGMRFRDSAGKLLDPIPANKLVILEFDDYVKKPFRRFPLK